MQICIYANFFCQVSWSQRCVEGGLLVHVLRSNRYKGVRKAGLGRCRCWTARQVRYVSEDPIGSSKARMALRVVSHWEKGLLCLHSDSEVDPWERYNLGSGSALWPRQHPKEVSAMSCLQPTLWAAKGISALVLKGRSELCTTAPTTVHLLFMEISPPWNSSSRSLVGFFS